MCIQSTAELIHSLQNQMSHLSYLSWRLCAPGPPAEVKGLKQGGRRQEDSTAAVLLLLLEVWGGRVKPLEVWGVRPSPPEFLNLSKQQ